MTASFRSKSTGKGAKLPTCLAALVLSVLSAAVSAQAPQSQAPAPQAPPAPSAPATQTPPAPSATAPPAAAAAAAPRPTDPVVPPGYVIGPDDLLSIVYWKDKDMSADAQVRPDGRIALPLINEVTAAGLTPEQLREKLVQESRKFMEDASITVVVRQINSRKAFITGEVNKPGPYPLTSPTTVMQLIAMAGGLRDYANSKKIVIMRTENGRSISLPFNYREVTSGKKLDQNVELKPGDTVVVP
jgi:polysaccharide biosynthesis/export protein